MARRRLTPAKPGHLAASMTSDAKPEFLGSSPPIAPSIAPPIAKVSGQSAEAAALREMAEGIQAAREEGRMLVDVPLSDVVPGFLVRDRIVLDREELDTLKASIRMSGQRVPAEIRTIESNDPKAPQKFGLISGWRRLTALNELHSETDDPKFSTLRALIRPAEEVANSYVAMIEENEVRVGLSYFERARLVAELARNGVFPDPATALRTLFSNASRAKRSKIGSFVDLVDTFDGVLKFPAEIPERLGLQLVASLREAGPQLGDEICSRLRDAAPRTAEAELALLTAAIKAPRAASALPAKVERLRPGLDMKVQHKPNGFVLTLSGEAVGAQLLEDIRGLLRAQNSAS